MECPRCKKPITGDDWMFCPRCGLNREEFEREQAAAKETETKEEVPENPRKYLEEPAETTEEEGGDDPLEPDAGEEAPAIVPRLVYEPDSPSAILSGLSHQAPTNIVSFTSEPPGAEVTINGKRRGKTPVETVLDPGVYRIRIVAEGYVPFQGKLKYSAQDSFAHHVKLEACPELVLPPGLISLDEERDKTTRLPLRVRREVDNGEMVFVPNTSFVMGLKKGNADEQPPHVVKTGAFYIDRFAVTNQQFAQYVQDSKTSVRPRMWKSELYRQPRQPVVGVNWYEAREFAIWMGADLPTEAEWEKAARAPDNRLFPWGNTRPTSELCCYSGSREQEGPVLVDALPQNVSPYGAEQMSGNTFEWCTDWYDASYYQGSPPRDPRGPENGMEKVVRGGSWFTHPLLTRVTARAHRAPDFLGTDCGFRCVIRCRPAAEMHESEEED